MTAGTPADGGVDALSNLWWDVAVWPCAHQFFWGEGKGNPQELIDSLDSVTNGGKKENVCMHVDPSTGRYMCNNFLHSRFIVLKYSDDGKGRKYMYMYPNVRLVCVHVATKLQHMRHYIPCGELVTGISCALHVHAESHILRRSRIGILDLARGAPLPVHVQEIAIAFYPRLEGRGS